MPGCATGEEAYSIAILLQEFFQETGHAYPVQIFASDISRNGDREGRGAGKYAETIAADVGAERLNRCFSKVGRRLPDQHKTLREMCVFSKHDLIHDPPFSKLDLITCRNITDFLWKRSARTSSRVFSYALKPGGFLVLGLLRNRVG